MKIRVFLMRKFYDWPCPTPTNVPNHWVVDGGFPGDRLGHETLDSFLPWTVLEYTYPFPKDEMQALRLGS